MQDQQDIRVLVERIREGDRGAGAEFVRRFGPRLQARVRAELGAHMRRVFDSQDIMSTLSRRFDLLVRAGGVRAGSEAQLLGLLGEMTRNAVLTKARLLSRVRRAEDGAKEQATGSAATAEERGPDVDESIVDRAFEVATDEIDRTILTLRLHDMDHQTIGEAVGLSPEACRWRWHRMRTKLREMLKLEIEDAG